MRNSTLLSVSESTEWGEGGEGGRGTRLEDRLKLTSEPRALRIVQVVLFRYMTWFIILCNGRPAIFELYPLAFQVRVLLRPDMQPSDLQTSTRRSFGVKFLGHCSVDYGNVGAKNSTAGLPGR